MQQVQPGSPSKKSRGARKLKKYNNTTYNNNIIIIFLEVADTSEASLGFPLRPYTYWLKRGARDFLKREGYPAASAASASPAGVIPKKADTYLPLGYKMWWLLLGLRLLHLL